MHLKELWARTFRIYPVYSLIHKTEISVTITSRVSIVRYDFLRWTKRISWASLKDLFDVTSRKYRYHWPVPQCLLLAQASVASIQIYSWIRDYRLVDIESDLIHSRDDLTCLNGERFDHILRNVSSFCFFFFFLFIDTPVVDVGI